MREQVVAPAPAAGRIEALDVLRGFALCGILLMNIVVMGLNRGGYPDLPAVIWAPDWTVWFVQSVGVEGTMRGLFTVLFGAGILMMTRREGANATDVYLRRCLMLMALGATNVVIFLFPGDILFVYGMTGLFLFAFRKAGPRTLLVLAGVVLLALSGKGIADTRPRALEMQEARVLAEAQAAGRALTPAEKEKAETWTQIVKRQGMESPRAKEQREQRTGGWLSVLTFSWSFWTTGLSTYLFDTVLETAGFMLVGMALFRLGVVTGERTRRVYALLALGGYAVGVPLNVWEAVTMWNDAFLPGDWIAWSTYQLSRLAMTIGHLGLVMLLWKAGALGWVGTALKAIGRLGLTNYLGQSAIAAVLFYGFGLFDTLSWVQLWGVCAAVWVGQAVFSLIYLRLFAIGPAEWLLRSVAYGRLQPLRG